MTLTHNNRPVLQMFDRSFLYCDGFVFCQCCGETTAPDIEEYIDRDEKDLHCRTCHHRIGVVSINMNIPATV